MKTPTPAKAELPIILFDDQKAWADWLKKHHGDATGVWLRLAKKNAELESVTYAEAVDVALCYGWIDGQSKRYDESSWIQRFTPRGPKSIWSKINREKVERLIKARRMRAPGLRAIESAKEDGRWDAAYDSPRTATVPDDLQAELDRSPEAKEFFSSLDSANRYAILFRVQTAKRPETRARRIATLVAMLEKGEKIHS